MANTWAQDYGLTPVEKPRGAFAAGLSSGIDDLKGLGYSAAAAVADTVGAKRARDALNEKADQAQFMSAQNGRPDLEKVEDVYDKPSKWLPWLAYQAAKQGPNIVGGIAAGLVIPEVFVPTALSRGAALLSSRLGGGSMTARVAEAAATGGSTEAARAAALAAGQTFGKQVVGGSAWNYGQSVGSLYQAAMDGGDPNAGAVSLLGGIPYAVTETLPEAMMVGRIGHGSGFSGGMAKRMAKAAASQAATGATSEVLQNEMEMAYNGHVTPEQAASQRLNSGAAGGAVEGLLGSLGGVRRHKVHGVAPAVPRIDDTPGESSSLLADTVAPNVDAPAAEAPPAGGLPLSVPAAAPAGVTAPSAAPVAAQPAAPEVEAAPATGPAPETLPPAGPTPEEMQAQDQSRVAQEQAAKLKESIAAKVAERLALTARAKDATGVKSTKAVDLFEGLERQLAAGLIDQNDMVSDLALITTGEMPKVASNIKARDNEVLKAQEAKHAADAQGNAGSPATDAGGGTGGAVNGVAERGMAGTTAPAVVPAPVGSVAPDGVRPASVGGTNALTTAPVAAPVAAPAPKPDLLSAGSAVTLAAKRLQAKSANVAEIVNTLPAAHKQELQVRVQNALAAGESSDVANAKSRVRVVTARVMGEMATAVHAQVHAQAATAVGRALSPAEQKVVTSLATLSPRDNKVVLDALGWDSEHHQVNEPLSYEAIGEKYKTRSTGEPMSRASVHAVLAKVGINESVLDTMRAHAMPEASVEELGISGEGATGYRVSDKQAAGADDFVVNARTAREQKETDAVLAAATPEAKKAAEAEIAARKSFTDTEFEEKRKAAAAQGQAKVDAETRTAEPKTLRDVLARDLARNSISEVNIEDATEHWDNETDTSKGEYLFADLHVLVQAAIVRAYRNNTLTAQRQGELIDENAHFTRQTRDGHAGANPEGAGRVGIERPADEGAAPRLPAPGRQAESAQRSAPTEQVDPDHRADATSTTQRERDLRAKAHDAEHLGDIQLGNDKFVSFDDATEAARRAIDAGVLRNVPFQYHNVLDIAPRDWSRMVDAMNDDGSGWAAGVNEGEPAGARSDTPNPQGGTIAGVNAALAKLMPVNAERVKVVQSLADIPPNVRRSVGVTENTQAFVIDGEAYLIADQIAPGTERAVFLHEVGAHLGMENLLDEDHYDVLVDKILEWAGRTDGSLEQRLAVKAMERVHSAGTEDHQLNSEMVAYFIEEAVNAGVDPTAVKHSTALGIWLAELMQSFKNALAKLGFVDGRGLTAQDLVDLAYGAAKIEMDGGVGSLAQVQTSQVQTPAPVVAKAPAASAVAPVKSAVRDEPLIEMRKRRSVLQALRTCLG